MKISKQVSIISEPVNHQMRSDKFIDEMLEKHKNLLILIDKKTKYRQN